MALVAGLEFNKKNNNNNNNIYMFILQIFF